MFISDPKIARRRYEQVLRRKRRKEKRAYRVGDSRAIERDFALSTSIADIKFFRGIIRGGRNRSRIKKTERISIPRQFSVIRDPEVALKVIGDIIAAVDGGATRIYINYGACEEHDLAAEALLASLVRSIKHCRPGIRFKGTFPENDVMRRLICSIGVVNALGVTDEPESERLRIFRKENIAAPGNISLGSIDAKTAAIGDFVVHIERCLADHDVKLSDDAKVALVGYMGEIIDNVEQHSGQNKWKIVGYLDNSTGANFCEIVIFNWGEPIAGTMLAEGVDSVIKSEVREYVDRHYVKKPKGVPSVSFPLDWTPIRRVFWQTTVRR